MAGGTFEGKGDAETAAEGSALAGIAAVAPQAAAVAAAIDSAGDLAHDASDAAKWVGDALDDVVGGGDEHPGQSTFPADPDAPPESDAEFEEKMARTNQAMHDGAALNRRLWNGKHQDIEHAVQGADAADVRWASRKARAGEVEDAGTAVHDGAFENPRLADLSQSDPHVNVTDDPDIDLDDLPTADHTPADVPFGSDVQLNPQPIPPGKAAAPLSEVDDSAIIIVGGRRPIRRGKGAGPEKAG